MAANNKVTDYVVFDVIEIVKIGRFKLKDLVYCRANSPKL